MQRRGEVYAAGMQRGAAWSALLRACAWSGVETGLLASLAGFALIDVPSLATDPQSVLVDALKLGGLCALFGAVFPALFRVLLPAKTPPRLPARPTAPTDARQPQPPPLTDARRPQPPPLTDARRPQPPPLTDPSPPQPPLFSGVACATRGWGRLAVGLLRLSPERLTFASQTDSFAARLDDLEQVDPVGTIPCGLRLRLRNGERATVWLTPWAAAALHDRLLQAWSARPQPAPDLEVLGLEWQRRASTMDGVEAKQLVRLFAALQCGSLVLAAAISMVPEVVLLLVGLAALSSGLLAVIATRAAAPIDRRLRALARVNLALLLVAGGIPAGAVYAGWLAYHWAIAPYAVGALLSAWGALRGPAWLDTDATAAT